MAVTRFRNARAPRLLRSLTALLACLGAGTCAESPAAAGSRAGNGRSHIILAPTFSASAATVLARRDAFPSVAFDHVHVILVRSPHDTVADTAVVFTPQTDAITLDLTVSVNVEGETFDATIEYVNAGLAEYRGQGRVRSHPVDQGGTPPQQVAVQYVGPGANAARVVLAPKTVVIVAPATATFTASVFDAGNALIANVPLAWSSSDPSAGTISSSGVFTPTGKRANLTISARTPTNLSDNAALSIALPASGVSLVSGAGQRGRVGAPLAQGATVRVVASDGVGISGATVTFSAPAGGHVGASSVVADVNGVASTSLTLGTVAGPQIFGASAAGFSVAIPETATPGDPATITAVSGGDQTDTVKHVLKNPLVAKVSDTFGNGVPNITVTWARSTGGGQLAATSSVTDSTGLASVGYTLGDSAGTATITASTAGVATPASFTVIAIGSPVIALSTKTLHFDGTPGAGSPASQLVSITNGGGGTLSGLQIGPISYGAGGSGWLQATLSGSIANPSATLTVQPFIGTLSQGTYAATIPILSSAATNSPQAVTVTFTVGPGLQLLTVTSAGVGSGVVSSTPAGIQCTLSGSSASGTCRFAFPYGSKVTLSATATGQSSFSGWGASGCPGTSPCVVTMTQPISVGAAFNLPGSQTMTQARRPPQ